ncbi:MAG: alpha-glucan family phosphorylase [Acidobacteria bacterium]|nr:alpha-glucan family phosphorylase [Acidobacteriota bacterium]
MSNRSTIGGRPSTGAEAPERPLGALRPPKVAYFSMEVALAPDVPTYSGGLGVLAGDTLRSAADLGVPMVGVTLLYRKGYFRQMLDASGAQSELPVEWNPADKLDLLEPIATVTIEGRPVNLRCWRYKVIGVTGHVVPVYLLDASMKTNSEWDQTLTDHLYGGDEHYRLCQELILGVGGVEMLSKLGHHDIETYHMNEGHSALLVLRLVERKLAKTEASFPTSADVADIRRQCVFTTHTPVPAGHDEFSGALVRQVLGANRTTLLFSTGFTGHDHLNMTHLALHHSNYVNGVAMKHGEVSREMFPNYRVKALTNGVHAATWTAPSVQELLDREVPEWRHDNMYLRYAINIPLSEVRRAHMEAKKTLLAEIAAETGVELDADAFTVGFARRATGYKRAPLFMSDPARLLRIAKKVGPLQVVYGGKAHPRDEGGKQNIRQIFDAAKKLGDALKVVYVPNYDWRWGALITSGVDLWLNTPIKTREASGTSGMKCALNGVPSLSTLDGWWIEGHIENLTGWSIDDQGGGEIEETASLYEKLEKVIVPLYYDDPDGFANVMRTSIALNGSFFNTQRMLLQYIFNAYATAARA